MNLLLDSIKTDIDCEELVCDDLFQYVQLKVNQTGVGFKKHNTGYWMNFNRLPLTNTLIQSSRIDKPSYYYARCKPTISFVIMVVCVTAFIIEITPAGKGRVYFILNDNYMIYANLIVTSFKNIRRKIFASLIKLQQTKSLDHFYDLHKNH